MNVLKKLLYFTQLIRWTYYITEIQDYITNFRDITQEKNGSNSCSTLDISTFIILKEILHYQQSKLER